MLIEFLKSIMRSFPNWMKIYCNYEELNEGLKISESADKLYIHRNTLFYRIEKIKKLINYDISNFNDAIEFKILFLYWKEMKLNNNF